MNFRLWQGFELIQRDMVVTDSLKALRTLQCQAGRVLTDSDEVLGQPHVEARRHAASLTRQLENQMSAAQAREGNEHFGDEMLGNLCNEVLKEARCFDGRGLTLQAPPISSAIEG